MGSGHPDTAGCVPSDYDIGLHYFVHCVVSYISERINDLSLESSWRSNAVSGAQSLTTGAGSPDPPYVELGLVAWMPMYLIFVFDLAVDASVTR